MTLEQKIGQMVQLDISLFVDANVPGLIDYEKLTEYITKYNIGSILNSPFSMIPGGWNASEWRNVIVNIQTIAKSHGSKIPILYGIDSIHGNLSLKNRFISKYLFLGASYVAGATLFPQQLSVAATFNPSIAYDAGVITSKDTRAAGIPWMFSPVLGLALQPLWARFYETFGEDPYLAAQMGAEIIQGYQLKDPLYDQSNPNRAAACMKHFIAVSKNFWLFYDFIIFIQYRVVSYRMSIICVIVLYESLCVYCSCYNSILILRAVMIEQQ